MRAALFVFLVCCAPVAKPPANDGDYPGVLHPPNELTPDFVVEQHVEAIKDGKSGGFDAVLQKRGSELVIVGLGPMGVRAFVLKQVGIEAEVEQRLGPQFPFPPRNVLVDVHRAFFKRLPPGVEKGRLDDEDVTEIWQDDQLRERSFRREGRVGAVRVLYGPGCKRDRCEAETITIKNEWFGYELRLENRRYTFL